MIAKITISLPEELVSQIDGLAAERGASRSLIIREAATDLVAAADEQKRLRERRAGVDRALEALEALRAVPGRTGRSGTSILREIRDSDDGGWRSEES